MSVDILPTSLPLDASKHFSSALLPYLESLIEDYAAPHSGHDIAEGDTYTAALERATIARNGKLTSKHAWLQDAVDKFHAVNTGVLLGNKKNGQLDNQAGVLRKKKLLMLGSGMVVGPAVDLIAKREDVRLMIGKSSLMYLWYPNDTLTGGCW